MILGHLIMGMLLGMISAAISLFFWASLLWALAIYSIVGILGTLLSAAIVYTLSRLSERRSHIKTCKWFSRGD